MSSLKVAVFTFGDACVVTVLEVYMLLKDI